jgi:hypothetical protein
MKLDELIYGKPYSWEPSHMNWATVLLFGHSWDWSGVKVLRRPLRLVCKLLGHQWERRVTRQTDSGIPLHQITCCQRCEEREPCGLY